MSDVCTLWHIRNGVLANSQAQAFLAASFPSHVGKAGSCIRESYLFHRQTWVVPEAASSSFRDVSSAARPAENWWKEEGGGVIRPTMCNQDICAIAVNCSILVAKISAPNEYGGGHNGTPAQCDRAEKCIRTEMSDKLLFRGEALRSKS